MAKPKQPKDETFTLQRVRRKKATTNLCLASQDILQIVPMREKAEIKEYYYEELENLSHHEREAWLAEQCLHFEQEVRSFIKDKETFVEIFHKKLRKITRRWASWNHRNFGQVTSREQVRELLLWSRQNQPKFTQAQQSSITDTEDNDPLEQFEKYCSKSNRLLQTFRQDIYRPLCDFFSGEDADAVVKEIKILEKCVQKWEALLQFSPVNERLFSKNSEKVVSQATRTLAHEPDSVVRLIPDLYEKKIEALGLARKWRLIVKAQEIQRRGTYTLSPKPLSRRENMPRCRILAVSNENFQTNNNKTYNEVNKELHETKYKFNEIQNELIDTKRKCDRYENEIVYRAKELDKLRDEVKQTNEMKNVLEMRVNESQISQTSSLFPSDVSEASRTKIWQRDIESIKLKYSTQKIKYMNARKSIESLNKQLENSQQKYGQLEKTAERTALKCNQLEDQLEIARKNIQTQGNMVDALQHQCYTLKHDLDDSNSKKAELYEQLGSTLERCKTVESDLLETKQKCNALLEETGRRKSHEEKLERENTQLRQLIDNTNGVGTVRRRSREDMLERENIQLKALLQQKSNNVIKQLPPKKECIFPDINGGRSL